MLRRLHTEKGIGLIELTVIIIVIGILAAVAMQSMNASVNDTRRVTTEHEMNMLAQAIVGDPSLTRDGERSDFGYFGDVGSFPPNLQALYSNPGSYSTWKGPYLPESFTQDTSGFKFDEWGAPYTYASGVSITSQGGGTPLVKKLADVPADYLRNEFAGVVKDMRDSLPGDIHKDSIDIKVTMPNGTGATLTKVYHPNAQGAFTLDSIPAGNHPLRIIYTPTNDTLLRQITVLPRQRTTDPKLYKLPMTFASASTAPLTFVHHSDSTYHDGNCNNVKFWLANNTGGSKTVTSIKLTWSHPTAYYGEIYWDGTRVFNMDGTPRGVSGVTYALSSPQTIADGDRIQVRVEDFREHNSSGGGQQVDMHDAEITVLLSDGTEFDIQAEHCH